MIICIWPCIYQSIHAYDYMYMTMYYMYMTMYYLYMYMYMTMFM